jgi:catechol 2,3-dioxygenase-like lactoylglutathione lyase family enzyme
MIHHVTLETPRERIDESVAFYALLEFARVDPPKQLVDVAVWVQRADHQVHLLFDEQPTAAPRGHLALVCPDYEATVARLEAAGWPYEPAEPFWGSPRGYVSDPVGHRIELMQFAP